MVPDAIDNSDTFEMVNVHDELTLDPELTTSVLVSRAPLVKRLIEGDLHLELDRSGSNVASDIVPTTPDIPIPSLLEKNTLALPNDIFYARKHATKIDNALYFEYERTDRRHKLGKMLGVGKLVMGLFDVVILWNDYGYRVSKIFLLRRIKNKEGKEEYDKKFIIDYDTQFKSHVSGGNAINKPFTGIQGYSIHSINSDNPNGTNYILPATEQPATYTLPATDINKKNLSFIRLTIQNGELFPSSRKFFNPDRD
jgi:hypothetical protein